METRERERVCVQERERENVCGCVHECVGVSERERERVDEDGSSRLNSQGQPTFLLLLTTAAKNELVEVDLASVRESIPARPSSCFDFNCSVSRWFGLTGANGGPQFDSRCCRAHVCPFRLESLNAIQVKMATSFQGRKKSEPSSRPKKIGG